MQPDSSASSITIPSASLPLSTARPLWNGLTAGMTLYAQFLTYTLPTGAVPYGPKRSGDMILVEWSWFSWSCGVRPRLSLLCVEGAD